MATPKMQELEIEGYENFKGEIPLLEKDADKKPLILLFTGSENADGHSWCPDCVVLEKTLETFKAKEGPTGCLVRVKVGPRDYWKDKNCPFRTDAKLKLSSVPTLMAWGTPKRLDGDSVNNLDNLSMLFEED